jgi:hypothetical protein
MGLKRKSDLDKDENKTIEFVYTHLTDECRVPSYKTFEPVIYKMPRPSVNVPFCRYAGACTIKRLQS